MTRPRLPLIAPAIALVSALGLGLTALAQDTSHDGHAMMGDKGPSSMAYMDANTRMHAAWRSNSPATPMSISSAA